MGALTSPARVAPPPLAPRARDALATLAGFVEGYFTDERGGPIRLSRGQRAACKVLEDGALGSDMLGSGLEMARGHGKSMLMKALVILAFLRGAYLPDRWGSRYAAILTNGTLYKQFSRDLGDICTGVGAPLVTDAGTPRLHIDFWIRPGYLYPDRRLTERQLWNQADKLVYVGTWDHPCRISVRGMTGGRGDVRGLTQGVQRPDLLIIDDPMKEGEADNEEITENVKSFVKRSFIPCGGPGARLAFFGTPFNDNDLITEVCGNAAAAPLRSEWPSIATACLPAVHPASGALLAPGIWTPEKLAARRVLVGSVAFSQEYLLNPKGGGARYFDPAWIARWTQPAPAQTADGKRLRRVMFCDPSLGRSKKSDCAAIVVLDHESAARIFWTQTARVERLRPQALVKAYLDLWEQFRPDIHGIEDEGAQELLIPIFQAEIAARRLPPAALPRLQSTGGVPKVTRVKRLSPMIEFGQIRWADTGSHRELRAQLTGWGGTPDEADDGPDALEAAIRLATTNPPTVNAAAWASANAR